MSRRSVPNTLTRLGVGGSVIDGLAGLPSAWIATESLAAGFNRPTKPRDLSQLVPVPISLKVNRAGNEHLRAKVDKRTRSKWSRVLRYALEYKCHSEPLDQFIKRKGGINSCASRFTRCLEGAAARASGLSPRAAL